MLESNHKNFSATLNTFSPRYQPAVQPTNSKIYRGLSETKWRALNFSPRESMIAPIIGAHRPYTLANSPLKVNKLDALPIQVVKSSHHNIIKQQNSLYNTFSGSTDFQEARKTLSTSRNLKSTFRQPYNLSIQETVDLIVKKDEIGIPLYKPENLILKPIPRAF